FGHCRQGEPKECRMPLLIHLPRSRVAPLRWVVNTVFNKMLAVPFVIVEGTEQQVTLAMDGHSLVLPSLFPELDADSSRWARLIPCCPLVVWDVAAQLPEAEPEAPLPVLFGDPWVKL